MPWLMLPPKKEIEEGDIIDVKNDYNRQVRIQLPSVVRLQGLKKMERNMNGDYEVDYFKDNRSSGFLFSRGKQQRLWFDPVVQFGKEIAYYANGVKSTAERGKHVELQQDKSEGRRGNFEKEKYFKVTGGQPSYGTGKDREWKAPWGSFGALGRNDKHSVDCEKAMVLISTTQASQIEEIINVEVGDRERNGIQRWNLI
ncbi:hypothetical protein V6N13_067165 [Hibiscus sabdariffa]